MPDTTTRRPRICMTGTIAFPLKMFFVPHIRRLRRDFDITTVANARAGLSEDLLAEHVAFEHLDIVREISLLGDVRALIQLWRLFRRGRYSIVLSNTPKAGLLSMMAAKAAGVPVRVHWFTGQVWATRRGLARWGLKAIDRLLGACATQLLADSRSQARFLEAEGVVDAGRVLVLGQGSVCGVDTSRFRPDPAARGRLRKHLDIADDAVVVLYLGRMNREKGVLELAEAFSAAAGACPSLRMLVVGPDESRMRETMSALLGESARHVRFLDYTPEPEAYMAASDVFVQPSYREGFGSTVIEAGACELPTVGTAIPGLSDAVVDGETGILVPVKDAGSLGAAIIRFAASPGLRREMGQAARLRVERSFRQDQLTAELEALFQRLLVSSR